MQVTAPPHICDEMASLDLAQEKHILSTRGEGSQDGDCFEEIRERNRKKAYVGFCRGSTILLRESEKRKYLELQTQQDSLLPWLTVN